MSLQNGSNSACFLNKKESTNKGITYDKNFKNNKQTLSQNYQTSFEYPDSSITFKVESFTRARDLDLALMQRFTAELLVKSHFA